MAVASACSRIHNSGSGDRERSFAPARAVWTTAPRLLLFCLQPAGNLANDGANRPVGGTEVLHCRGRRAAVSASVRVTPGVPKRQSQPLPRGSRGFPFRAQRKSAAVGALRRARAGDGAHADEGRSDTGGGTVGVDIHEQSHGWGSQVIEFFAIGTAVIPDEDAEDHVIPDPTTVLDLA
jgi:hypothetical protein